MQANQPAVESLFQNVVRDLGALTLVVHHIDGRVPGIFRKGIAVHESALAVLRQSRSELAFMGKEQKSTSNAPKWSLLGLLIYEFTA
jgi:hypothetical protein